MALVFVTQTVVGVWSAYQQNMEGYRDYQKRDGEDQKKTADDIAKRCAALDQTNPLLRECLREAIVGYQKTQHNDRDLQAQQDMAFWALVSAIVAGCGLIVSITGVGIVWQSLTQTRTAILNDREIGEAQVRAYLTVEAAAQHSPKMSSGKFFTAELKIKNTGQSPAHNVRHIACLMPLEYPLPDNQGDLIEPDPDSIEQGGTLGAAAESRIAAELTRPLTTEEVASVISEGPIRLYAVVVVTYFDVFRRIERKTKYCSYLTKGVEAVSPQTGRSYMKHEWALANVHNDAT